jgi:hypothetical protein
MSAQAEPGPAHAAMARARAAVKPGSRPADYQTGHARTAALPSLDELELDGPVDEHAVPLAAATELVGVTQQALNQLVNRGTLPAYRDARGRRVCLLDDLLDSAPGRRQAAQVAEQTRLEAMSQDLHEQPAWLTGSAAHPDWCTLCRREGRSARRPES